MRYDEAPDAELIAAIPSSAAAFDAFYRRHIAAVMRFLARRCNTIRGRGRRRRGHVRRRLWVLVDLPLGAWERRRAALRHCSQRGV